MAKQIPTSYTQFNGGIADFPRDGIPNSYAFGQSIDVRSDPQNVTVLPRTIKESGATITDLVKWTEIYTPTLMTYMYGDSGNLYSRDPVRRYTTIRSIANSHGNGMVYSAEDGNLYGASDKLIWKYGPLQDNHIFYENWANGINTAIWSNWGAPQVAVSGGFLGINSTTYAGYYGIQISNFNLTGSFITNQVIDVGSRSLTSWEVYPINVNLDANTQVFWFIDSSNNLKAKKVLAGVTTTLASTTYVASTHKYFRIRESGGTTYFDYSTDNYSWVGFASLANPFAITSVVVSIFAGTYASEATTTTAQFGVFTTGVTVTDPTFVDDYFGSQGGVPLNTNSLSLVAASSQYASRADTASLSITGSIAIDMQIKPTTLPAVGNQMVLMSKWDESGVTRSYKFDINTAAGFFGDGSDSTLTISANATESPIDSSCTGNSGTYTLLATNVSFAGGQVIFIHQSQGTNAGQAERNIIDSYTAGTITLRTALIGNYAVGAQVRVLKQYTSVTINSGVTYTAKAWNGTTGGIIGFLCSGTVTVTGTISASGKGFRGASAQSTNNAVGNSGEGTAGASISQSFVANGNGGGGGNNTPSTRGGGGGGGGNANAGSAGETYPSNKTGGLGGLAVGSADLTTIDIGGGGGSGSPNDASNPGAAGGSGGGIVFIAGVTLASTGAIVANGNAGSNAGSNYNGGGGGGAGGSILLKAQIATLGTLITATGGAGGTITTEAGAGGNGSDGRTHLDYYTSYTGTTTPSLDATQDNTLVTNTSSQLRLSLSSTGSNSEILAFSANIQTATWQQVGVSWNATTKLATFYLGGNPIGTRTGTLGAIHDNASTFQIGMSKNGAGSAANFYDGLMDEARLFNATRSDSDMFYGLNQQIPTNTPGLVYYGKLNNDYTDATGVNNLTATNAPVFTTDVPYPSPTTRLDIDQSASGVGNTYAVPTAISEASVDRITFTPLRDPQKSIQFNVGNIGTGTWTITIHDSNNNVMATSTVTNANMHTGNYEFVFANVWRPLTNFINPYHAHITCASGSPTVVSGTVNDLTTATYVTYFQFLVEDTAWHPMARYLNFWLVGNEKYVGKYEATLYNPNLLAMSAGWRVRCMADFLEYKVFGAMKGVNISGVDSGRIYFWDGAEPTFNFYIDVPEGGINAMLGTRNVLYVWAGYKNKLLIYQSAYLAASANKLKDMPLMENTASSEIYPQAVTMWQSLLRYAPYGGTTTAVQKGVYTWGSTNVRYPEILTYDYPISTRNTGSSVNIGSLTVVNEELLIAWRDGLACGVDYVNAFNAPYPNSFVEFLITDDNAIWKEKNMLEVDAITTALTSDQAITLSYSLDGSSTFTPNPDPTATNDNHSRLLITNGRYFEAQIRLDILSGVTAPTIKGLVAVPNANDTEARYG